MRTHWSRYQEGCARVGRPADLANWRVAKSVFVADDLATARRYATHPDSSYRFYYRQILAKMRKGGRVELFKTHREQPDDETLDAICERLIIWGTSDKVADELMAFRDAVGEFGMLLHAGHDWADRRLGRRSMTLLAEKVAPMIQADARPAATPKGRPPRLPERPIENRASLLRKAL